VIEIRRDDLSGEATRALVALHLAGMREGSPPECVFALDLSGLAAPSVTVWSAWRAGGIAGIAALRDLGAGHGEIKSMRTHPRHLRRGVAAALLDHLIAEARRRGWIALSLETGRGAAFDPASALYRSRGFAEGAPFADYPRNPFSVFMDRVL
jgi:putative acetyltransferase